MPRNAKRKKSQRPPARKAVRKTTRTRAPRDARLAEALAQQAATSEILRLIGASPTDLQPVLDMMADRAMRLCGAVHAGVLTFDGELIHLASHSQVSSGFVEALRRRYPMRPGRSTAGGRAVLTRAIVHVPDMEKDSDYSFTLSAREAGFRSTLAVPMLRGDQVLGAIVLLGPEPVPFTDRQIELLRTFADQAAIAIENARLFRALGARNQDLGRSLEQRTA